MDMLKYTYYTTICIFHCYIYICTQICPDHIICRYIAQKWSTKAIRTKNHLTFRTSFRNIYIYTSTLHETDWHPQIQSVMYWAKAYGTLKFALVQMEADDPRLWQVGRLDPESSCSSRTREPYPERKILNMQNIVVLLDTGLKHV